jgi:hypothetical protein
MGAGGGSYMQMAGSVLQSIAALSDAIQMREEFQKEAARQGDFRTQALGEVDNRTKIAGIDQTQRDLATGAAGRKQAYSASNTTPLAFGAHNQGVASAGRDAAYADYLGGTRANLGAYNDWAMQNAIRNLNTQRKMGEIENFAGGTARVFPYKMYEAQHAFDDLTAIGQGLSSAGGSGFGGQGLVDQAPQQGPVMNRDYAGTTYGFGYDAPVGTGYNPQMDQSYNRNDPYNLNSYYGGY